jgi:Asp-tRNA(Asn)/Glu-tRNA(Gln) amidotransferase A subunit family amidase
MNSLARALLFVATATSAVSAQSARSRHFEVTEATIASVHAAMTSKMLTCRQLVQSYLDRIDAYDQRGPAINAIVTVNPQALAIADSLDRRFSREGFIGPLHCVPMIVKDNFETRDLQTTAGSLALAGWVPLQDATMVRKIRAAGAIVLAKSNLAEWAFTPYETVSSILPGYTKNPYALDRVTAGSSGGTAAAVAASLGLVGLGTDTGNSIRGPSAHQALVGIRSTMGLSSRAGVVPLNATADVAGPMARTVADAAAVFDVVVGSDPADTVTRDADAHRAGDYRTFVKPAALRGARIGTLRQAYERPTTDSEVVQVFTRASSAMTDAGAVIVDVRIDSLDAILKLGGGCNRFRYDLEQYFAARGQNAPVKTVDAILKSGNFHPTVRGNLQSSQTVTDTPDVNPACKARETMRAALRTAVVALMDSLKLDALIYPTWSNPPRKIGDLNTPHGDNSQLFSPSTGFPAITVPMGWTRDGQLPAGITLFGRPWSDGDLIALASGVEATLHARHAPASTPALAAKLIAPRSGTSRSSH